MVFTSLLIEDNQVFRVMTSLISILFYQYTESVTKIKVQFFITFSEINLKTLHKYLYKMSAKRKVSLLLNVKHMFQGMLFSTFIRKVKPWKASFISENTGRTFNNCLQWTCPWYECFIACKALWAIAKHYTMPIPKVLFSCSN